MQGSASAVPSVGQVAPTHDSIDLISQDMKTLVKKIQDLRHLGIEDSRIALPKICVVGDQSTGKSSLIEGMSEIKVPRSAGTCTRCPMEINLSESEPGESWTCKILLSRKYMFDGSRKIAKIPKKSQPLGPWIEQDEDTELFHTLKNKAEVQETLKWAQLAILNPSRPSSDYMPGSNMGTDPAMCQVKFSPNVVRLDISAPNFPNLSFYDLPGVISQTEFDEERYLVSLVENLVKEYISQENCIVLLTLPMTDDATNSNAARIIRDVRGAKARTLGVLTKPDRVQTGESFSQWVEILEGDKFALGHGYYVIRNNPDTSIEHSKARDEEAEFFSAAPWATELSLYQERFGTRHLQTALSCLLLEQIQGCLPRVIQQIDEKAARIDAELQTLPDPPSANVPYILCRQLNTFKEHIRASMDGPSPNYPLLKLWTHIAHDFRRALAKTRPSVRLLSDSEERIVKESRSREVVGADGEVTLPQRPRNANSSGDDQSPQPPDAKAKLGGSDSGYATSHFEAFDKSLKMFTWEEIREINQDSYRAGLPNQVDPNAIGVMNQLAVKHWKQPMTVFLNATYKLVKDMLIRQLDGVFGQFHQTGLYRELKRIVEGYLQTARKEHFRHAEENYNIEWSRPFTLDELLLQNATKAAFQYLNSCRNRKRANAYLDIHGSKFPFGDPRRENEIKKLELGDDPYNLELKMMAVSLPAPVPFFSGNAY